jgi:hypothetical protein
MNCTSQSELEFFKSLWGLGTKEEQGYPTVLEFYNFMWANNREGIGLTYWHARLHMLDESVPWNQFLGSLKV